MSAAEARKRESSHPIGLRWRHPRGEPKGLSDNSLPRAPPGLSRMLYYQKHSNLVIEGHKR